jgi:hypothetical protein
MYEKYFNVKTMNSKHSIILLSFLLFALSGLATGLEGNGSATNQSYSNNYSKYSLISRCSIYFDQPGTLSGKNSCGERGCVKNIS